jgi:molybdopterin synthase catalytic subunit
MAKISQNATVRISAKSMAMLTELARQHGKSRQSVLEAAIASYHRDTLLDSANAAFSRLKANAPAWQAELAERALFDQALLDGIDAE